MIDYKHKHPQAYRPAPVADSHPTILECVLTALFPVIIAVMMFTACLY